MKVLLISHNPITTYQSMGKTFLSLFSEFNRDELCQLYIYPTLPDADVCHSYYRITDRNVFESYWHFGKVNGRELTIIDIDTTKHDFYENEKEESFINVKKTVLKTVLRDIMWEFSRWFNVSLKEWINLEKPTCIFLAPGEAKFIYNIALRISKEYSIPIVTYICDEFYFVERPKGLIGIMQLRQLKGKIEELLSQTKKIITISDELNCAYSSYFHIPAVTIYTGSNIKLTDTALMNRKIKGLTYMGNLAYGRLDSLIQIGKALEWINTQTNEDYKLFVYTRGLLDEEKRLLETVRTMQYCGYVTGEEFYDVFAGADVLIHVESFEPEEIDRVKNSISTKIADILCSGKPLLAYGPAEIASIKYLKSNEAACVATSNKELTERLMMLFDETYREALSKQELYIAKKNHSTHDNSIKLYNELKYVSV